MTSLHQAKTVHQSRSLGQETKTPTKDCEITTSAEQKDPRSHNEFASLIERAFRGY
jgi:hypothetical protein